VRIQSRSFFSLPLRSASASMNDGSVSESHMPPDGSAAAGWRIRSLKSTSSTLSGSNTTMLMTVSFSRRMENGHGMQLRGFREFYAKIRKRSLFQPRDCARRLT
jgi:hypothetical protein